MDPAAGVDLKALLREANVQEVLDQLDRELIGLVPVKQRIREIAAYLIVSKARASLGSVGRRVGKECSCRCMSRWPRISSTATWCHAR